MTARLRSVVALVVLAALYPRHEMIHASQCPGSGPPPVNGALASASVVFAGEVLSQRRVRDSGHEYTFRVSCIWKGDVKDTAVVYSYSRSRLGFPFKTGGSYIVYAYRGTIGLKTDVCSRTAELGETNDPQILPFPIHTYWIAGMAKSIELPNVSPEILVGALASPDERVRKQAVLALAVRLDVLPLLRARLEDPSATVRAVTAMALIELGEGKTAMPTVIGLLEARSAEAVEVGQWLRTAGPRVIAALADALLNGDIPLEAVDRLKQIGIIGRIIPLIEEARSEQKQDRRVQAEAILSLASGGT